MHFDHALRCHRSSCFPIYLLRTPQIQPSGDLDLLNFNICTRNLVADFKMEETENLGMLSSEADPGAFGSTPEEVADETVNFSSATASFWPSQSTSAATNSSFFVGFCNAIIFSRKRNPSSLPSPSSEEEEEEEEKWATTVSCSGRKKTRGRRMCCRNNKNKK